MIGTTLAHFKITDKLGEGGMGVVWRAEDSELGRAVAIKVLPAEMAADPDRLDRFRREAQSIAKLNHPNIVTLHSVAEDQGVHFLVLELIEGQGLDRVVARGGLGLERLFELAVPIADALAEAHEKGITHRDLKPANVMVTDAGVVKILDFGLAKLTEEPGDDQATELLTKAGTLLGTMHYMSPEQVQGREADHRSDIFSFGILLYEMATGQRPFGGEDPASVISSILRDEPRPVTELKSGLPNHLGRIVRRCLEKDPELRFQSTKELRIELTNLQREVKASVAGSEVRDWRPATALEVKPRPHSRSLLRSVVMTSVTLLAGVAGAWLFMRLGSAPSTLPTSDPIRFSVQLPAGHQTFLTNPQAGVIVSPLGDRIVWEYKGPDETFRLAARNLDSMEIETLEGSEGARGAFYSPDGRWIAFFARGELRKIPAQGGPATKLCSVSMGFGGVWSKNEEVFFATANALFKVPAVGGVPEPLIASPQVVLEGLGLEEGGLQSQDLRPAITPDGEELLFGVRLPVALPGGAIGRERWIVAFRLDERSFRKVTPGSSPQVAGHHVFLSRNRVLLAATWDSQSGSLATEPHPVLSDVELDAWRGPQTSVGGSTLAYLPVGSRSAGDLVLVDRFGEEVDVLRENVSNSAPGGRLSPGGRSVLIRLTTPESLGWEMWRFDPGGRSAHLGEGLGPIWRSDGGAWAFVGFTANGGISAVHVGSTAGTEVSEARVEVDVPVLVLGSWSAELQQIVAMALTNETGWDLWTLSTESWEARPWVASPANEFYPRLSPDGRWVAFSTDQSGTFEVHVRSFPDGERETVVSTDGGQMPVWSGDGRRLYFRRGSSVWFSELEEADGQLVPRTPELLFDGPFRANENFDVSDDEQVFLLNRYREDQRSRVHVISNWTTWLEEQLAER